VAIFRDSASPRSSPRACADAIAKRRSGRKNNQDISSCRQVAFASSSFARNDPMPTLFRRAERANQGVLEFVEMFKAPIKTLHRC